MPHAETVDSTEPKKLILCFDGTGNTFSGSNADTNVVKILRKMDRNHPNQYHYYQSERYPAADFRQLLLITSKPVLVPMISMNSL
jgi:20S proteasome alpha/beta subunit